MSSIEIEPGDDIDLDISDLLARNAAAERRLLKQERKAERRLEDARAQQARDERRLQRAQERLKDSQRTVADAEDALRACQARRAVGPPFPCE